MCVLVRACVCMFVCLFCVCLLLLFFGVCEREREGRERGRKRAVQETAIKFCQPI